MEDDGTEGGSEGDGRTAGTGVGLAGTAERLHLLYGDNQAFSAGPVAGGGGGFRVRATLPVRRAEAAPP